MWALSLLVLLIFCCCCCFYVPTNFFEAITAAFIRWWWRWTTFGVVYYYFVCFSTHLPIYYISTSFFFWGTSFRHFWFCLLNGCWLRSCRGICLQIKFFAFYWTNPRKKYFIIRFIWLRNKIWRKTRKWRNGKRVHCLFSL